MANFNLTNETETTLNTAILFHIKKTRQGCKIKFEVSGQNYNYTSFAERPQWQIDRFENVKELIKSAGAHMDDKYWWHIPEFFTKEETTEVTTMTEGDFDLFACPTIKQVTTKVKIHTLEYILNQVAESYKVTIAK